MVSAQFFDGLTAANQVVTLTLDGEWLQMRGELLAREWPLSEVKVSERLGQTPRRIVLPDGGHCEVTDHGALDELLLQGGYRHGLLDGMQHSMRWALLSAMLIVIVFASVYRYLLPWGAEAIAQSIPPSILQKMGASSLQTLDQLMLVPSQLSLERRQALRAAYARLNALPDAQLAYHIEFRSAPQIGPNAFALPDGTIVMLDELVEAAGSDEEVLAVLAHERGHVEQRHALRMVLQSSAVGMALTWYMGDVSTLLTTVPAMLVQANYSREMEREADEYAARTLSLNGLSPCLLPDILLKLEAVHAKRQSAAVQESTMMDYLASHPPTEERSALLCTAH